MEQGRFFFYGREDEDDEEDVNWISFKQHFFSSCPSIDNLNKQISRKSKNYDKTFRETLVKIINLLGEYAYINGKLNKEFISEKIFNNKSLLDSLNSLIHPRVQKAFDLWLKHQNSKYILAATKKVRYNFTMKKATYFQLEIQVESLKVKFQVKL